MYDAPGGSGDVTVAAALAAAHRGCEACGAGQCETGAYAVRALAAYRAERARALGRLPRQREG